MAKFIEVESFTSKDATIQMRTQKIVGSKSTRHVLDIRRFYRDEGIMKPGKSGVALGLEEVQTLRTLLSERGDEIEKFLKSVDELPKGKDDVPF